MNNFDKSSSGIDIEASVFHDSLMSYENFRENFEEADSSFGKDLWVYTNFGNIYYQLRKKWNIPEDRKLSMKDLIGYIDYDDLFEIDWTTVSKKTLGKWILDNYRDDLRMTKGEMEDYVYDALKDDYSNLEYFEEQLDKLGVKYKKKFEVISVRGYSQGDYGEVLVLIDELRSMWGTNESISNEELLRDIQKESEHYFYDAPMCVRVVVNGQDYYSEKFDGMYEIWGELQYSKEEVIDEFVQMIDIEDKALLKEELDKVIPEKLEYN